MTVVERALCAMGLHAWRVLESGQRITAVCARDGRHRRLLEVTPLEEPASSTTTLEIRFDAADTPEDKIASPEAEIKSAPTDISPDIPKAPESAAPPGFRVGRGPVPSRVPCAAGYKLHRWGAPDADGWLRCLRGCGAGRWAGDKVERVYEPESVPKIVKAEPAAEEDDQADEEIIFKPDPPAPAITGLPIETDDPDDDDGIVRPRPGVARLSREQLAPLVGRDDRVRVLSVRAPCPKCGTGQLVRDPLEPDDQSAFACLACGYRPTLSAEEAAPLAKEMELAVGKTRIRQPSINGMKL